MRKIGGRPTALALAAALTGMLPVLTSVSAQAQTYRVLYAFTGGTDGGYPSAGLIRDTAGNLYGTTSGGGRPCASGYSTGCGTLFKLDTGGKETVLHIFRGGADGAQPMAGLVQNASGVLFGTTYAGGGNSCNYYLGCGTVFKADAAGKERVLYAFAGIGEAGSPAGLSPVLDAAGNLYGTTGAGGTFDAGTIFRLDPSGAETVLYSFTGGTDGASPLAGLIMDAEGNFYGTTYSGGSPSCQCGTVFKLYTSGVLSVLHTFAGGEDGSAPYASLMRDAAGNLYGTTLSGGTANLGTVFKLDETGKEQVLHSFTGGADGSYPFAGLVRDAAGNLYGTASSGGAYGHGTVFNLNAIGEEVVLHSFSGADGSGPEANLVLDPNGNLYGTTNGGGAYGAGVVFGIELRSP